MFTRLSLLMLLLKKSNAFIRSVTRSQHDQERLQPPAWHKVQRLFVDVPLIRSGSSIELPQDKSHYLMSVLRMKHGENIRIFNGVDGEHLAVLQDDRIQTKRLREKDYRCVLYIPEESRIRHQPELSYKSVHLLFAVLKVT
jgi:hypothetical protein